MLLINIKKSFKKMKSASLNFLDSASTALIDDYHKTLLDIVNRVRAGPGKPGKSWNFFMAFSRTGKSWKIATCPGKFWKCVKLS